MEYLVAIINSLAWPAVVLILSFYLRDPLNKLIASIETLKYGGLEITLRRELQEITNQGVSSGDKIKTSTKEVHQFVEMSPSSAILAAWQKIEQAADRKIKQLIDGHEALAKARRNPLLFFEIREVFIPSTTSAIIKLRELRNEVAHAHNSYISNESALNYVIIAKGISEQIDALTELPKQSLTLLTLLISTFNSLVDSGKYNYINIEEIHTQIKNKNIIKYLKDKTEADFSIFGEDGPYSDNLERYHEQMLMIYNGYAGDERRKWGVENSGLCLLIAWTNEIIQQGAGWYPNE